jgi:hypothetical protein
MAVQMTLPGLTYPYSEIELPNNTSRAELWTYPNCPTQALQNNAKYIGEAGEAFFDSIAKRFGLLVATLPEAESADRVLLMPGRSILTQIKTTTNPVNGAYRFSISKGFNGSPNGVRKYDLDDYDLLALVILRENAIYFTTRKQSYQSVPISAIPHLRNRPQETLEEAFRELGVSIPMDRLNTGGGFDA